MSQSNSRSSRGTRSRCAAAAIALAALAMPGIAAARNAPEPLFEPSPLSPIEVGDRPVALEGTSELTADGRGELTVLSRGSASFAVFETRRGKLLRIDRGRTVPSPTGMAILQGGSRNSYMLVPSAGPGLVQLLRSPISAELGDPLRFRPLRSFDVGPKPGEAIFDAYIGYFAVLNREPATVSAIASSSAGTFHITATQAVGAQPSDMAVGGAGVLYVTNRGSGTITSLFADDRKTFSTVRQIPTGVSPSAIAAGDFHPNDHRDDELAVTDTAARTVTILDSPDESNDYVPVHTYRVGRRPTQLLAGRLDAGRSVDLAVLDPGADRVRLLLNKGGGSFERGPSYPTGRNPVAITQLGFNRYFEPDLAIANAGSDDVTVLLRHQPALCRGRPAMPFVGTPAGDILHGSRGPDRITAMGGDDQIASSTAADCIYAGDGRDVAAGNFGDDWIQGGKGADSLDGGDGSDHIYGGDGPDWIRGDSIGRVLGPWSDTLTGGRGDDRIEGGAGRDQVGAGPGNDRIDAQGGGADRINCGPGTDRVTYDRHDRLSNCERVRHPHAPPRVQ